MFTWLSLRRTRPAKRLIDLQKMDVGLSDETSRVLASAGVPTFRHALPSMTAELNRARRYQRPLATVVVAGNQGWRRGTLDTPGDRGAHHGNGNGHGNGHGQPVAGSAYVPVIVASLLREFLREVDIVTYAASLGRCIVLMPEVTALDARQALGRIGFVCASRLTFPVCAGTAGFPEHGWTLEDLIASARANEQALDGAEPVNGSDADTRAIV